MGEKLGEQMIPIIRKPTVLIIIPQRLESSTLSPPSPGSPASPSLAYNPSEVRDAVENPLDKLQAGIYHP